MLMTDIMPKEAWQALEQEIHERYGLNARVYDAKGSTFTGHTTWANRLCPVIKAQPQGVSAICSVAHSAMAAEARSTGASVVSECDAGLLKICVPVMVDGAMVGVVGGCGRLLGEGEVDAFMVEKSAGIDGAEVEDLCSGIAAMSTDEAETVAAELAGRVDAILKDFALRR
ncbi:MAG: PocR ligand-binding domain-containing protein [Humidesulfovibrio sp.]|nr:PocR ligand-binding domain-containing protein [Humidesulfovibrio sp.]